MNEFIVYALSYGTPQNAGQFVSISIGQTFIWLDPSPKTAKIQPRASCQSTN